eukprot:516825_1
MSHNRKRNRKKRSKHKVIDVPNGTNDSTEQIIEDIDAIIAKELDTSDSENNRETTANESKNSIGNKISNTFQRISKQISNATAIGNGTDDTSKAQAFAAAFYMRRNSDQLKDLRLKLDEAIDSGDIVQIQYLYSCATNMSASLPLELMERARLTIALFNAMTTNKIDDTVSYIRQ